MHFSFDKLETFGAGVTAYRIVREQNPEPACELEVPRTVTPKTDRAKRLGDRLREKFQQPAKSR